MSDDPILAALTRLEASVARLETGQVRLETEQTRLCEQLNNKLDDILDKMAAQRTDLDTTRGNVLYTMQDSLTLSQRISKLEEQMRKPL